MFKLSADSVVAPTPSPSYNSVLGSIKQQTPTSIAPREMLSNSYGKMLPDVLEHARAYRAANPSLKPMQDISTNALNTPISVVPFNKLPGDTSSINGGYHPPTNQLGIRPGQLPWDTTRALDHEVTHGMQRLSEGNLALPRYTPDHVTISHEFPASIRPAISQLPGRGPDSDYSWELGRKSNSELEPRLAEMKRRYFREKGVEIRTPDDAHKFFEENAPRDNDYNGLFNWRAKPNDKQKFQFRDYLEKLMPGLVNNPQPLNKISADHHNVYVVELAHEALGNKRLAKLNARRNPDKPPVYVGSTGLTPEQRFAKHKDGLKGNTLVARLGVKLLPELYQKYNPMGFRKAEEMETFLANKLREEGYTVLGGGGAKVK